MPRRDLSKPGPKSKRGGSDTSRSKIRSLLGDGSSNEASSNGEAFMSADLDNQTDYGLNFTSSRINSSRNSRRSNATNPTSRRLPDQPKQTPAAAQQGRQNPSTIRKPRKQLTPQRRDQKFFRAVQQLQIRADNLIPKTSFARLVREMLMVLSDEANRVTATALVALQEASEMYLTALFQDAYCCTLHRGRVTLNVKDIELTRFLRGRSDPGNR